MATYRFNLFTIPEPSAINMIALVKGRERYVFLFDDESRAACLLMMGKFAVDPELSFSWWDAGVLSSKVRQMAKA